MNINKNYLIIIVLIFNLIFRISFVYAATYNYNWSNYVHATSSGDFYSFNPDGSKYIASAPDGSAYWTSITVNGYLAAGASFQLVMNDGSGDSLGSIYSSVPQTISLPNGPYYTGVRLLLHNSNGESEIYISSGTTSNGNSAIYTRPSDYNPPSNGGGESSGGGGVTLSAPTNVSASNVTDSSATISWDPVSGANGYRVYQNGSLFADVGNTTSYNLTGLQSGNQYSIQVSAYDSNGESPLSGAVTIVTKTGNPIVINPPPININIPTPLPIEFPPAPPAVNPPAVAQAPSIGPVNIPNEQQFSTTMPQYVPQHYNPNTDGEYPMQGYTPPDLTVPDSISSPGPLPSNPDPTIMPHDPAPAIDSPNTKDTPQQMDPVNMDTPRSPDLINMDQPKMPDPVNMDTPKSPDPAGSMDAPLQRDPPLTPDPPLK